MKKIILIITLFLGSLSATAQESQYNFVLQDGKVYWQKVYENIDNSETISFFTNGIFKITRQDSTTITGETTSNELPFKKHGYSRGWVRFTYLNPCVIYFSVDVKDNKYRVTISNIIWSTSMYFMGTMVPETIDITKSTLNKKGKLTNHALNDFEMLNKIMLDMFDATKNEAPKKGEW